MARGLIYASWPYATVGLVVDDEDRICDCAPYVRRWAMGQPLRWVWQELQRKGAWLLWMTL